MKQSRRNGRKFGLTMAIVASIIALLLLYRRHTTGAAVLGSVAATFVLAALLTPKLLEPVETIWMSFARVLGAVNTRILMSLLYFIMILPMGLFLRLIRKDEMKRRWPAGSSTNWEDYRARQRDERHYENMF